MLYLLSFSIPIVFFISLASFFFMNELAIDNAGVLNIFQLNISKANYRLIPALISYCTVGLLISLFWIVSWFFLPKIRIASYSFLPTGIFLMLIGFFPMDKSTESLINNFCLSVAYILFFFIGLTILFGISDILKNKILLSLFMICMGYQFYDKFAEIQNDIDLNYLIIISFIWYLFLGAYCKSECRSKFTSVQQP